ncbi:MAG: hypothetical protein RLP02_03130 [Coleofasciculus sp. C2-GNP5-27]
MKILILGNSEDVHAVHLKQALTQAGATVYYLDTHLFPTQFTGISSRSFASYDTRVYSRNQYSQLCD